jgi:hypothetical protein
LNEPFEEAKTLKKAKVVRVQNLLEVDELIGETRKCLGLSCCKRKPVWAWVEALGARHGLRQWARTSQWS